MKENEVRIIVGNGQFMFLSDIDSSHYQRG